MVVEPIAAGTMSMEEGTRWPSPASKDEDLQAGDTATLDVIF
jgi:hypothetical protein